MACKRSPPFEADSGRQAVYSRQSEVATDV